MTPRARRAQTTMERAVTRLPWALALLAIAATIGTWVLVVANRPVLTSIAQASLIEGVVPLSFAVAGELVASRLPSNPVGSLLLATAVLVALSGVAAQLAVHGALVRPGSVPGVPWFAWLADWISAPVFPGGLIPVLFLLFPSGRVVSPRWRAVAWGPSSPALPSRW